MVTSAGVVTTISGTSTAGFRNGARLQAIFNFPHGIAVDSNGTIYVADSTNQLIRKIPTSGNVSTVAGRTSTSGSTDGSSSVATFSSPYGVAVDSNGTLYVVDYASHIVRKVSSSGNVTTLAGFATTYGSTNGFGSAARFHNPCGISVDSQGISYVADLNNNMIRKITATGNATTLAGSGDMDNIDGYGTAASFYQPSSVSVDSSGNIYVADSSNQLIRMVTSAGLVTTLTGTAMVSGSDDGLSTTALFNYPSGVAVDSNGFYYVADTVNSIIRRSVIIYQCSLSPTCTGFLNFTTLPSLSASLDVVLPIQPVVYVTDMYGSSVSSSNITLALFTNVNCSASATSAVISGGSAVSNSTGYSVFTSFTIKTAGTFYLQASGSGAASTCLSKSILIT